jgi:hypothetical protein
VALVSELIEQYDVDQDALDMVFVLVGVQLVVSAHC